jgi:hypothetical protein
MARRTIQRRTRTMRNGNHRRGQYNEISDFLSLNPERQRLLLVEKVIISPGSVSIFT